MNTFTKTQVRLFASARSWIEGEAVRQLYAVAGLDGVRIAAGFPDLQPGKGTPVGAAFVTERVVYPHLIGGDIGCGMTLFKVDLVRSDVQLDRWARLPFNLEHMWEGSVGDVLADHDLLPSEFDASIGTVGAGNHFAELQAVEQVYDARGFKAFGLGKRQLVALVHSGSRGLGEKVLENHVVLYGSQGTPVDSFAAEEYLAGHDEAVRWAKANREVIARRLLSTIGVSAETLWDGCHNSIERVETTLGPLWAHRKGAVSTRGRFVVLAGSRGSLSYLLKPTSNGPTHAWSIAHGAGRKWSRSEARLRIRERFDASHLERTALGGRVVCEERDLLYEEAPAAYKDVEAVVGDLVDAGLVSVVATFRPLLTYKTRKRVR
ncbi:MAG: RNA ligase RtcB family protein [Verrucomicrobia bacterium]|nr:RNA ligase RtcB family protein [Verrucomicrobiota bacterium]MBI3869236.1 RNA ligase RtcB family protein [Verrucomicrobiota bacterium]